MIDLDLSGETLEKYSKYCSKDLSRIVFDCITPGEGEKTQQIDTYRNKLKVWLRDQPDIEKFDDFCLQSAADIWEACNLLKIPLPRRVKLRIEKGNRSSEGDATTDYEIRISPDKVNEWLERYTFFDRLESKMFYFHECYHLWQLIHFPRQFVSGDKKVEVSAMMFENKMLNSFHPQTPKEFIAKIVKLVETKLQLRHESQKK